MAFTDLTKAFDLISREFLWDVLATYGNPEKYIQIQDFVNHFKADQK